MRDLRLVAANERGSHLVLRSTDGEKFVVSIDERLRAAVRGDRSRFDPVDGEASDLRPAHIQAQIRAGATAEQVARTAGVPIERVRRFEGPVLAEREHVATLAGKGTVRRPGLDSRPTSLGECIAERLDAAGICADGLGWDSWRGDDGRWVVQVAYSHGDRTEVARYRYDVRARSVVADNDEARWLTGELAERPQQQPFVPRIASTETPPVELRPALQMDFALPVCDVGRAEPETGPPTERLSPLDSSGRVTGTESSAPVRPGRSRRASVPAWDDIMFGARQPE